MFAGSACHVRVAWVGGLGLISRENSSLEENSWALGWAAQGGVSTGCGTQGQGLGDEEMLGHRLCSMIPKVSPGLVSSVIVLPWE